MPESKTREKLIKMIIDDKEDNHLEDEEMLHLLLESKVSKNINRVQNENLSFGDRMADNIAKFAGSWRFIIIFIACLILWMLVNTLLLIHAFDEYPFILLNLVLSCIAAIQAPVIMMSQNRQEAKDRLRSQNDYKTNLKSEIILEDIHVKLDRLISNQEKLMLRIEKLEKRGEKEK